MYASTLDPVFEFIGADVIDLWISTDLTDWLHQYAPNNSTTFRSKEHPQHIIKVVKTTLT